MVGAVAWSLLAARRWALAELGTSQSISEWQTWRQEAQQLPDRRPPKSGEPPGLILMRDHFLVCLVGAALFTSMLYWILVWFVTGMLRAPADGAQPGRGTASRS
jgi:hypothetical protein